MDTVNMAFRDEDSISYQISKKQICSDFYNEDMKFLKHYTKMHKNIVQAVKPNFMNSLLFLSPVILYICLNDNNFKILKCHVYRIFVPPF